ncbi:transcriptional initiation protein Tat [Gordoniibacillus kamchatkensis]|uniref:Transcriptional initiation protein Tat n=1 Tax=Gordoniibacillus kamchatkensis TaxID=1590651 RepID=A0ABR5ALQ7_9BACL|nr:DUF1501 domain-containing protein [Paenibacillus sp. VKM B-2647]KIL41872.1 transcriptional initiation protein Tat [Paenibacillus sp. VKM B-2647]
MNMSRREFLVKGAALLATLGIGGPLVLADKYSGLSAQAAAGTEGGAALPAVDSPVLVVVQLSGGNDGINTVVPYGQGVYYDARPTLAIKQQDVLAINGELGFHPSLSGLHALYKQGKVAVIQGVGYPKPDHSHFRSMEIWQTAEPDKISQSGWLGRYVESSLARETNPLKALQIGGDANKAFNSETAFTPVIQSLDTFQLLDARIKLGALEKNRLTEAFLAMYDPAKQLTQVRVAARRGQEAYRAASALHKLSGAYPGKTEYPNTGFAKDLQLVAKLLSGGSGTRVYYTQVGGFDDHANEKEQHARVLKEVDGAIAAFYSDLASLGLQDRVVTAVFSEFGRRVKENGSGGTDHGTAAPLLVVGGRVQGGLYGEYPSLSNLDNGDLKYNVDFRSVYYTLIEDWLKGDAKSVLGKTYEKIAFV